MEIFHELEGNPQEQDEQKRGKQEEHSRTSQITHPLDNQTHKIHKVHEQQREIRYMVEFIPNPMKEMRA